MGWTACVYVIATETGEVKVGWSSTPYARLSKVKREYAARRGFTQAWLVGFVHTPDFLAVELLAHERLLPYATGGEWFRHDAEAALQVVLDVARERDPAATIQRPAAARRCRSRA